MGYFLKYFSLVKLLSWGRMVHFIRIQILHVATRLTKRVQALEPYNLSIELSSICNLKCPQCPVGLGQINREKKFMEYEKANQILNSFSPKGLVLNLYFQGESMLHPNFFEIATLGPQKNLFTILSTNATLINTENAEKLIQTGIHRIIISADGIDQKAYEKYRIGGQSKTVWSSIELLSKAKKKLNKNWPEIIVQTLVNKHNEESLGKIRKYALEKGANKVNFKTMQIYQDHEEWLPSNKKYRRYKGQNLIKAPKNKCLRALSGIVISSDGEILPCCHDKQAEDGFGNINNGFKTITRGDKRKRFLETIYLTKQMHSICKNCPEAMRVYKKK